MKRIFFIAALFVSFTAFAQTGANSDSVSSVVVHKDPRLDLLVTKHAQVNEYASRDARKTGKGFRLMIISTNSRDEAIAAKAKVYTYFPELKAYLWHQSPYYKVKAGNFKDRKDAEAFQQRLNVYFPKGVYVMNDIVELKPEKSIEEDL